MSIVLVAGLFAAVAAAPTQAAPSPRCSGSEVRDLVRGFVDAYNRGDAAYLEQIWAQEPDFFWYFDNSDPSRRAALSENRATLGAHFTRRNLLGDNLRLRDLSVSWQRGWHGAWGVAFELTRTSDDAAAAGRFHGKAAATCQRLHAWAMGRDA